MTGATRKTGLQLPPRVGWSPLKLLLEYFRITYTTYTWSVIWRPIILSTAMTLKPWNLRHGPTWHTLPAAKAVVYCTAWLGKSERAALSEAEGLGAHQCCNTSATGAHRLDLLLVGSKDFDSYHRITRWNLNHQPGLFYLPSLLSSRCDTSEAASGSPQRWSPCECAEWGGSPSHGKSWENMGNIDIRHMSKHVKTCQNTDQQWQLAGPWRHGDPSTTFFLESFFSAGSLEGWQNHCKARARTGCSRPQLPHTGRLRWLRKWAPHLMIQNEEVFS